MGKCIVCCVSQQNLAVIVQLLTPTGAWNPLLLWAFPSTASSSQLGFASIATIHTLYENLSRTRTRGSRTYPERSDSFILVDFSLPRLVHRYEVYRYGLARHVKPHGHQALVSSIFMVLTSTLSRL